MTEIQYDDHLIAELFDAQPQAVIWFKPVYSKDNEQLVIDFKYFYCNEEALNYSGLPKNQLLGLNVSTSPILDDEFRKKVFQVLFDVLETGKRADSNVYNPVLKKHVRILHSRISGGVLAVLQDRTKEHELLEEIKSREAFSESILNASINAVYACEAIRNEKGEIIDLLMQRINPAFTRMIHLSAQEVIGKTYLTLFPSSKKNGIFNMNCEVITSGKPIRKEIYYKGDKLNAWYDISLSKLGENGLVVTFTDITEQKVTALETERQKNLLDNILTHSPSGISVTEVIRDENGNVVDGKTIIANDASVRFNGVPMDIYLSKNISEIDPNILTSSLFQQALLTLKTGKPFITQYFFEPNSRWLEVGISRMDEDHIINVFTDITPIKEAQLSIEQSAKNLSDVINTSQSGMSLYKPIKNEAGELIDFRFDITNPMFLSYIGQRPEKVIGDPVSKWYPIYKTNGLFELCKETYQTGKTNRGEVHYIGHGVDGWADMTATKLGDGILITLTDLTDVKRLQLQMKKSLEELKRSNANLQEFAYAASHDLKEPVRKVHIFTDRLKQQCGPFLNDEGKRNFERLQTAAERMGLLIDDLLDYSQVSQGAHSLEEVNLNEKVRTVMNDLEVTIEEKKAIITLGELPAIKGNRRQLQQLFQNLIGNALKYSQPDVTPQIHITSRVVTGHETKLNLSAKELNKPFYVIEVSDNGIGFEQEDAERIFNVFQRLHGNSEYKGTGIGLSIVRKVVENHNGYITAESKVGKGSTFRIYLPVSE